MPGKSFLYMGSEVKIERIEHQEDDLFKVITDKKEMLVSEEELIKDFMEIHSAEDEGRKLTVVDSVIQNNNQMHDLSAILMDNIKKVQQDPKYIDQAKAINDQVKTIVDIKKTQIEALRVTKELWT